ncbi:uncharacterized protein Scgbeta [Fopius arisanus]|uniref:Beta-sarcoglycan n=1 Tax=Fopius arisanus TaxID=64838 RepID=A0A9R1STU1_9HYME|nr:PREDICTED: uncharacterized protein LOC105262883 [Fopius arisanus]XP_011297044.1 PREDICTED: uncharacterized protein LOC105262883 [Fopius arisanus]XP_011297045.1 PREDICTED: uncharacterized protein LOC105262883 [Fopius arisanus]
MSSFPETETDTGSPSMSKAEDNLSNSDGPLLKRSLGRNNTSISLRNGSSGKSSRSPSRTPTHRQSSSSFDPEKKRYCLWTLTCILAVIGLCNLLLSITIIDVLRVSRGMESLEVIPEESLVKFFGNTDLDHVCVERGICQGYGDEPVEFSGHDAGVHLNVQNHRYDHIRSDFRVLKNVTSVSQVKSFEIKDPHGHLLFSTNFSNFGSLRGVDRIDVKLAQTHRIVSPVNETLLLDSKKQVSMHGAESLGMEGKEIILMANNDVNFKSNDSIFLDATHGVFLDVQKIPIAPPFVSSGRSEALQYKICVCMPEGKLFRVPVTPGNMNCARVSNSPEDDPCR